MLVRCKTERKGGSLVEFPGAAYHFRPAEPGGPHVAEIGDAAHLERLLSIPEGYEPAEPVPAASDEATDAIGEIPDAVTAVIAAPDECGDEVVAEAFAAIHGRAPNGKAKRETIIGRINEAARERGWTD